MIEKGLSEDELRVKYLLDIAKMAMKEDIKLDAITR